MLTDEFIINNILDKFWDDRISQEKLIELTHNYWKRGLDQESIDILLHRCNTGESYEKMSERFGITRQGVNYRVDKACETIRLELYRQTKT